jgi:hypothetical protein
LNINIHIVETKTNTRSGATAAFLKINCSSINGMKNILKMPLGVTLELMS